MIPVRHAVNEGLRRGEGSSKVVQAAGRAATTSISLKLAGTVAAFQPNTQSLEALLSPPQIANTSRPELTMNRQRFLAPGLELQTAAAGVGSAGRSGYQAESGFPPDHLNGANAR